MVFCIFPNQTPQLFFSLFVFYLPSALTIPREPTEKWGGHKHKGNQCTTVVSICIGTHTMHSTKTQQDCVFVFVGVMEKEGFALPLIPLSQEGVVLNVLPSNRMQSHITQTVLLNSVPCWEDKYLHFLLSIHTHTIFPFNLYTSPSCLSSLLFSVTGSAAQQIQWNVFILKQPYVILYIIYFEKGTQITTHSGFII